MAAGSVKTTPKSIVRFWQCTMMSVHDDENMSRFSLFWQTSWYASFLAETIIIVDKNEKVAC